MARGGMRIGEVLKVRAGDVSDQKIILYDPKSGKESEAVYIPKKVAERLKEYINAKNLGPNKRIFPFGYSRARDTYWRHTYILGQSILTDAHWS